MMQAIRIKRLMLQFRFQEVLPTSKAELWCELTIAILITWQNIDLCFMSKIYVDGRLRKRGVIYACFIC